jgi:O-antigen/teichoic acid export membrane protein
LLILFFVNNAEAAKWVNFLMALPALLVFGGLNIYLFKKHHLHWTGVKWRTVMASVKRNLPLAGNNLSVQLQQSFFLFVLAGTGNALLLGAYAIIDKVLWAFRLILIAFSNALMPKAVHLAERAPELAKRRKRQINWILAGVFSLIALLLFAKPEWIVIWFAGKDVAMATALARAVALVPLLMALNALNVIQMLVQHRYRDIFKIAILLTGITVFTSLVVFSRGGIKTIAWYPLSMEAAALLLYLFFLNRKQKDVRLA